MIVSRKMLAGMLIKYINREIDLSSLISWAEEMMKDADFENEYFELIRDILARIGLADVREFGLNWDNCYDYLHRLGYDVRVEVSETI
ncbi:MAG: hypothetical protein FJ264_11760 [Planctomycetes bacterium]|nr:hypothetical protein [Planctomycetota bacterium]